VPSQRIQRIGQTGGGSYVVKIVAGGEDFRQTFEYDWL
jgi:hypothetical protein